MLIVMKFCKQVNMTLSSNESSDVRLVLAPVRLITVAKQLLLLTLNV